MQPSERQAPKPKLTKKQQSLAAELEHLLSVLGLDPAEIVAESDSKTRTMYLELAKDQMIRSAVILKYVLMDEFLSGIICWHYFGKKRSFPKLWKIKRFQTFNYFVLERLYLLQKLDLVRNAHEIPRWVSSDLAALNELRNGIAHSFFPQNRRRKPDWKGQSVFSLSGFDRFLDDMQKLSDYFAENFWRGSPEDISDRPDAASPRDGINGAK